MHEWMNGGDDDDDEGTPWHMLYGIAEILSSKNVSSAL